MDRAGSGVRVAPSCLDAKGTVAQAILTGVAIASLPAVEGHRQGGDHVPLAHTPAQSLNTPRADAGLRHLVRARHEGAARSICVCLPPAHRHLRPLLDCLATRHAAMLPASRTPRTPPCRALPTARLVRPGRRRRWVFGGDEGHDEPNTRRPPKGHVSSRAQRPAANLHT